MPAPQQIHLVIPTTPGREAILRRTLGCLAAAEPPGCPATVCVLENGSPSETLRPLVEEMGRGARIPFEYRHYTRGNKSAALNAWMRELPAEEGLVLFLDDDVRFAPTLLRDYERGVTAGPAGAYFGGPLPVDFEGEPPPRWLLAFLPLSAKGWEPGPDEALKLFIGPNWAAWLNDMRQAGGFDESRGPGAATGSTGQETAMMEALWGLGRRPHYLADARVWHWVPRDRCSPEWALERAVRRGTERGLKIRRKRSGWPAPLVAVELGGARLILWLAGLALMLHPSPVQRFRGRWLRRYSQGLARALQLPPTAGG